MSNKNIFNENIDDKIVSELKLHKAQYVEEFFKLFPSSIYRGSIALKTDSDWIGQYCAIKYNSVDDFWKNWNRFKNIKTLI